MVYWLWERYCIQSYQNRQYKIKKLKYWQRQYELKTTTIYRSEEHQTPNTNYRIQNTDGLKIQIPSTNMQSTKNTEWIQMDWKLRIIDKRQEWRSGQSLTFFSLWWICTSYCIVLTLCILGILCGDFAQGIFYTVYFISYFVFCELYCICALYIGHFPWWLCKMYFVHCVLIYFVVHIFLIFCTCIFALYIWFFCGEFAHHTSYIGLCILYFSHCYTVYLCSVHCKFLLFLRWVCASRLICCQDPP